jgi:hypothetical protein
VWAIDNAYTVDIALRHSAKMSLRDIPFIDLPDVIAAIQPAHLMLQGKSPTGDSPEAWFLKNRA